jgi:hypothetical protein
MSDLPWTTGDDAPFRNGAAGRAKCRRHSWITYLGAEPSCERCGVIRVPEVSRRSKNNRSRGNAKERAWCHRLALEHTGQFGGTVDGANALFVGQLKTRQTGSFPGWMSDELEKLAALATGKTPILGIVEAPGPGKRERRLVVIDERDWLALHVGTLP